MDGQGWQKKDGDGLERPATDVEPGHAPGQGESGPGGWEVFEDRFLIVYKSKKLLAEFRIFETASSSPALSLYLKDWMHSGQTTGNPDDAEEFANGSVKWDGCSNWSFNEVCHHGCERWHLSVIGRVLARCWDIAAEVMPGWVEEIAGKKGED